MQITPLQHYPFSVVVPVYNEEENLPSLLPQLLKACRAVGEQFEIILVDDGSKDRSAEMLSQAAADFPGEILAVLLNRNYGQHAAIMAGFAQSKGEIVITIDADLQNPPEEIGQVHAAARHYDVVGTIRKNRHDSFFRRFSSRIVNRVTAQATGVMMHDYGCMLRGYRRPVIDAMLDCHERSIFIPVLANSFARSTTEIEVGHAARNEGESKYSVWKLVNLQFDLLTSMTTLPLRLLSVMGVIVSFLGIGFGVMLLILRFLLGDTWANQGVFTLFAVLFIFVGAQFIGMGLLGEYIGRIYHDVRGRPLYFLDKVTGASQLNGRTGQANGSQPAESVTEVTS